MNRVEGRLHVAGLLTCENFDPPDETVGNDAWDPASPLDADNQEHKHRPSYTQGNGVTAVDKTHVLHIVMGATARAKKFVAGVEAAAVGDSTVTVDLKVDGVSILTAPISISSATPANTPQSATIATPNLTVGKIVKVVVDATVGTGTLPTGFFAQAEIDEDAE